MKRLPPLPALHTFLITARCCNFTHAAEQLHITQGAVSRQIAGLESHLGYALFQRQARGLSLTAEGREWLPRVEQVFGLISEGGTDRREPRHPATQGVHLRDALVVATPDAVAERAAGRACAADHHGAARGRLQPRTLRRRGDLRRPAPSTLGAYHLFDEQLTPVCSPALLEGAIPLKTPADLQQHMLLHPTLDTHDWNTWLKASGTVLNNIGKGQHFETLDLAMSVASQGTG